MNEHTWIQAILAKLDLLSVGQQTDKYELVVLVAQHPDPITALREFITPPNVCENTVALLLAAATYNRNQSWLQMLLGAITEEHLVWILLARATKLFVWHAELPAFVQTCLAPLVANQFVAHTTTFTQSLPCLFSDVHASIYMPHLFNTLPPTGYAVLVATAMDAARLEVIDETIVARTDLSAPVLIDSIVDLISSDVTEEDLLCTTMYRLWRYGWRPDADNGTLSRILMALLSRKTLGLLRYVCQVLNYNPPTTVWLTVQYTISNTLRKQTPVWTATLLHILSQAPGDPIPCHGFVIGRPVISPIRTDRPLLAIPNAPGRKRHLSADSSQPPKARATCARVLKF